MRLRFDRAHLRTVTSVTAFALALPISTQALCQAVAQTNLTTDDQAFLMSLGYEPAAHVDANLINPWGMSYSNTSPFWLSDQGTAKSTLYNGAGVPQALVVSIPGNGGPTGQVFNGTTDFQLTPNNPARFIFANLDGSISGWNPTVNLTNALVAVPASQGTVYTGLATGNNGSGNFLYAANIAGGTIDVFDANFQPATLGGNFVDPNLPGGYSPFNVANINGTLYVTYALGPDPDEADLGTGIVDRFTTDGVFLDRFVTADLTNNVLSPWGVTQAPSSWDQFANAILIGNFAEEDGFINAFASDGTYLGMLMVGSDPFNVPYLWALGTRSPTSGFDSSAVFFTAGIGDEEHGLFGKLNSVPEPGTWTTMLMGFGAVGFAMRRRKRIEMTLRQLA